MPMKRYKPEQIVTTALQSISSALKIAYLV
jgi:hypothetical protein